jgi:hypothetical protein
MHLPASVRVYLCTSACDMPRSFDGLHALVTKSMELDAFGGKLHAYLPAIQTQVVPKSQSGGEDHRRYRGAWGRRRRAARRQMRAQMAPAVQPARTSVGQWTPR